MPSPRESISADKRAEFYLKGARDHGCKYKEFDWSSTALILNLFFTYDVFSTYFARRLAPKGLSLSAFNLMMILKRIEKDGCPLHEISDHLLVSRANVTGLVDILARKGLVTRVADEKDRRVKIARLTTKGISLLESMLPDHYQDIQKLLTGINKTQKAQLCKLLTAMRVSTEDQRNNPANGEGR